mgnify:CR=1 FL=1
MNSPLHKQSALRIALLVLALTCVGLGAFLLTAYGKKAKEPSNPISIQLAADRTSLHLSGKLDEQRGRIAVAEDLDLAELRISVKNMTEHPLDGLTIAITSTPVAALVWRRVSQDDQEQREVAEYRFDIQRLAVEEEKSILLNVGVIDIEEGSLQFHATVTQDQDVLTTASWGAITVVR